jgi:hypothetical protein
VAPLFYAKCGDLGYSALLFDHPFYLIVKIAIGRPEGKPVLLIISKKIP